MPKIKSSIKKSKERVTKITKEYNLASFSLVGNTKLEIITMLEKLTNINIRDIPIDKKVLSLFCNPHALKVQSSEIFRNTGTLRLGIFDTYDFDFLLSKLQPTSLEDLKNILKIDFSNSYKYTSAIDFLLNEEIKYRNCNDKRLWDNVLYAYYLGYYKYYYPLEFYKVIFENEEYYLNPKVIKKGYQTVKKRLLELNDVTIENDIIPRKKSIDEIAEEEGLEIVLEVLARNINIEIKPKNISKYYKIEINKEANKLIILINDEKNNAEKIDNGDKKIKKRSSKNGKN